MKSLFSFFKSIIKPFKTQTQKDFDLPEISALSDGSNKTRFYLNDPTTPNLVGEQEPPKNTCFPMTVKDDMGPGYPMGTAQQQASACKIVVNNLLSYLLLLHKLTNPNSKLSNWSIKKPISIMPRAGVDLNAYYDRSSLRFFYYKDQNKIVYACDSTPVVSHEFGHAFLDALRPDFWSAQAFEVWAYHESFGDIASIISSLQNDQIIRQAIEETNGDLLKSNVITRIGAEMGMAYYRMVKDKNGMPTNCLRDISAVYKYVSPLQLPKNGKDNTLIYESHNFSRVFTGAFYEMCVKVAQKVLKEGICKDLCESLKLSRDICSRYLIKATSSAPLTSNLFEALAKNILLADAKEGSKYQDIIKSVFIGRGILKNKILMLSDKKISDVKKELKDEAYLLESFDSQKVITTTTSRTIKILDKRVMLLKNNHLYGLQIEVPSQTSYYFDKDDHLVDIVGTSDDEAIDSAIQCLDYLDKNNLIGRHSDALFDIKEGKIVRKQIKCKCGLPNYCDPNAPEFNKPWKPKNHSSCCKCTGPNCLPRSCDCDSNTSEVTKKKSYCRTTLISCTSNKYKVGQFLKRKVCSN